MITQATEISWVMIAVISIYMLVLIAIGLYMNRKVKNTDDYWVGGRSIGPVVTAMSYCAAYYSTVAVIGGPATVYQYGVAYMMPNLLGATFTTGILIFVLMALKMRVVSERSQAVSLPSFLNVRFESRSVGAIAGVIIAVMMIPYSVSVLKGIADGFNVLAGVPYEVAVVVLSLVSILYLMFSGYWGIAQTDMIQGILIALGMVALCIYVVVSCGGVTELIQGATAADPARMADPPAYYGNMWNCLSVCWVWQIIAFGQPQLVTKFMGLKDSRTMKTVIRVSVPWIAIFLTCSGLIALGGLYMFGPDVENPDTISSAMAFASHNVILQALFLIAAVAAGLSTLVALILTASAAITRDLYQDIYLASRGKTIDGKKSIHISRAVTIVILLITMVMTLDPPGLVWEISTMASAGMGSAFFACTLIGMYWKRATKAATIVSMIVGTSVTVIWYVAGLSYLVHPFLPGMVLSVICFVVISLFTQAPTQDTVDMFFKKDWKRRRSVERA